MPQAGLSMTVYDQVDTFFFAVRSVFISGFHGSSFTGTLLLAYFGFSSALCTPIGIEK